ncbi:hypothetical protein A2V56_00760 [Candidatus Woesebacteria bacterium RBG_19FT_COMBO_42_9]|uniref:7TM-DISM receptor extracellular domain-containing protein n=1 Tax=Candidatus Woesebacteria bacterium RBG_16_42_24 TaxID=1802485 RepID=A0A1F7XK99_9BACT|nr:MAG: hypothetical protein A2V97_00620 [Candidatus Woesebacteria bacterium RBG_16_42_24]OGM16566.1 MAG: hypothetical protein A2V56_00760 [Candidatus Woesebacteria bacterium RBG_19FT_COMBO_42_9]OGM66180.1 MAG: hypothetical protein A2985_00695 [Candidatus Woesebacteria bacterium RIFCSPLOWO2_01_FULL_43_11]
MYSERLTKLLLSLLGGIYLVEYFQDGLYTDLGMLGFNKKTTTRRRLTFIVFILGATLASFFLGSLSFPKNITFQNLWGVASVCLSGIAGILAIIKLVTRRKNKYVFIAVAFSGIALLEGYSLFVPLPLTSLVWMISRIFLAAYLLLSLKDWREGEGKQKSLRLRVYIAAAASTLIIIALFSLLPTYDPYNPIGPFGRPIELTAVILFGIAAIGYYTKGYWEFKYFEFWLVLSLIAAFFSQVYMSFSQTYFDSMFWGAIIFKNLGYILALVGLLESTWAAFREVEAEKKYLAGHTKGEAYLKGE